MPEFLNFLGLSGEVSPGPLFERLFFFGLGLVGLATLIMLVVGGMMYLTAGDSQDQTKRARGYMTNAIYGLVLAFISWLILYTINPDLVKGLLLNPPKIRGATTSQVNDQSTDLSPLGAKVDNKDFDVLDQEGIKSFQKECAQKAASAGKSHLAPEKVNGPGKITVFCIFK